MTRFRSTSTRPLMTLFAMLGLGVFIAAPTPGDVGGCSSSSESTVVTGNGTQSDEYVYWDRGLCSNFCEALRSCRSLCRSLVSPPDGCDDNGDPGSQAMAVAFAQCVRGDTGTLRADFFGGATSCPHQCPPINGQATHFTRAYGWDVQACGDALASRVCQPASVDSSGQITDTGTLGSVLVDPPLECLNVCQ